MRGFGAANQRLEARLIVDRDIGQHFPIERDARALQSADELAVRNLGQAARGVDPDDPQRTEIAFLEPAADVPVAQRLFYGFLCGTVQLRLGEKETLGTAQGFVAVIPPTGTSFDSWHVCSFNLLAEG